MDRRTVLVGTGVALSATVAGCSEFDGDTDTPEDDEESDEVVDDQPEDNESNDEQIAEDDDPDDSEVDQSDETESQEQSDQQDHDQDDEEFGPEEADGGEDTADDSKGEDVGSETDEENGDETGDDENEDAEDDEQELAEDVEGEVVIPDSPGVHLEEAAADHLEVRNHAMTWNDPEEGGCKVYVQLEKTSDGIHHISFDNEVSVYEEDGERLAGMLSSGESNAEFEKGETRVYSIGLGPCKGAAEYRVEMVRFGASLPMDELEAEFTMSSDLEGKLEIVDHDFSWAHGGSPTHSSEFARTTAKVENVTEDYRLAVRGPDGEDFYETIELDPGETGEFDLYAQRPADVDSYGFNIGSVEVNDLTEDDEDEDDEDDEHDVTDVEGEIIISEQHQEYVTVTDHGLEEHPISDDEEETAWCFGEVEVVNVADDDVRWIRCRCRVKIYENGRLLDEEIETSSSSYTPGETFEFSLPLQNCDRATEYEVEIGVPDIHY